MPLQEMKRTTRRGFQQQTREVATPTRTVDTRSQILGALGKFAEAGYGLASTELQKKVEEDKVRQANRAAEDLMRSAEERQGITEDATKAGQLAYNMIVGKHDTMEAGNQFIDWYSQNPDADEDTINDMKSQIFQPILDKYGKDPQTLKAVSLQVQDAQFSIVQAQERIRKEHQTKKASEAMTISINDLLADPNADVTQLVDVELPARAKALGQTEWDLKASLVNQAVARAGDGDNRLLKELQGRDWSKNMPALDKAQRDYDSFVAKQNAIVIGDRMADIETQALSGSTSWETTLRKIEGLNEQYPNTYSKERVASLKKQRAASIQRQKTTTNISIDSSKAFTDDNAIPLGLLTKYTPKEKNDYINQLESQWANKANTYVEKKGYSESDANTAIIKEKLDWSRVQRMVVPSLKDNLDALINLNPEETTEEELPAYATNALQVIEMMDDTTLAMYFKDKDRLAMAMNIKSGMKNRSAYSAFRRAYDIRRNPYNINNEQRTEQRDAAYEAVEEKLTFNWYDLGKKDVPEWQRNKLAIRVGEEAQSYLYRGGLDTKQNASTAASSLLAGYSQTFNNTMINKTKPELAQSLGVKSELVDRYLKHFATTVLSSEEINPLGISAEDIEFVVNDTGTTFIMVDRDGEQIGDARFLMQDVKRYGKKGEEGRITQIVEESELERAREEAFKENSEEAAHMALFYLQQRGYR
ncbi:lysozyme domain-containing protein [Vibrio phage phi-A318]|uniref:Uncharacterized protein n=2 Tax=Kaohsiungvirus TaxID=2731674 RepID=A0A067YIS9_9CAUD|nr:lysozyme domain-containing protein [Vibrio phage phi-A318]YP_009783896.1 lysozyme domain-containing protein [Vibrio phage AS51]AGZ17762.1 hypothetical protein [Vibrio phage phi-A318]AHC94072.1 hypothetical protein [Vibrio phage AS51]